MKYRADIDGLRTLAVLPVIFYHANFQLFSGGFVGVDVFFVISGFLITSILIGEADKGGISLIKFYERRARRLLPALFFVLFSTLIAGFFLLSTDDYLSAFKAAASALGFSANIFYFFTVDYFSQSAEMMPFLHMWSLGVEEQFYLLWPFLLILFYKTSASLSRNSVLLFVLSIITVCSFLASIIALSLSPDAGFYLIPFRFWELAVGGLAAIVFVRFQSINNYFPNVLSLFGLVLVLFSVFYLDSESPFPSYAAIPVVFGTVLLLLYGSAPGNRVSSVLRFPPVVYLGTLSYSLYLIHWPVFSLFRNYQQDSIIAPGDAVVLCVLTLIISAFCFYFVEKPFRYKLRSPVAFGALASLICVFLLVTYVGISYGGFPSREPGTPDYVKSRDVMWSWPCSQVSVQGLPGRHCAFGEPWGSTKNKVVLWGDSHADHFAPLVEYAALEKGTSVLLLRGCPAFLDNRSVRRLHKGSTSYSDRCGVKHQQIIDWLGSDPGVHSIYMAAAWSGYPRSLFSDDLEEPDRDTDTGANLLGSGLMHTVERIPDNMSIHILTDVPRPNKVLTSCASDSANLVFRKDSMDLCAPLGRSEVELWHASTTDVIFEVADKFSNVKAHDMVANYCGREHCDIFVNGRLLYRDDNHIRRNLTDKEKQILSDRYGISKII
ncbi:acyltransferase [Microbulbifer agarilyticus]|uniref:acyltransferase family protein n=1 Tax=Microbulbifer agarilyticus TaxID=260552 RepID=UPI001C954797|nr:acyltransferase family protein [Microbulbifer agarilyticus]MBY6189179.1 acyltransferase [Microbulbifer agarilyticus]